MDINTITQAVSMIGFPAIACYYVYTDSKKREEKDREERKEDKDLWLKELESQRELYKNEITETRKGFTEKLDQFAVSLSEIAISMKDNNVRLDNVEEEVKDLKNIIVERSK